MERPIMSRDPDESGATNFAGLALLCVSTAAELAQLLPPSQLHGFFVAVGRRMAAFQRLDGISEVSAMSAHVNAFWQAIGWGAVEITLGADAVTVHHAHAPRHLDGMNLAAWPDLLLAVVEGAYDAWFRQLGSGPALTTKAEWNGDSIEIRHGR
jgi:hypothetical protein